jgi:hypothetical protein
MLESIPFCRESYGVHPDPQVDLAAASRCEMFIVIVSLRETRLVHSVQKNPPNDLMACCQQSALPSRRKC